MATDRFEYRSLPGVVARAWAEEALEFPPQQLTEAGLAIAVCPLCSGTLHCRIVATDLIDLHCAAGCSAREVAGWVRERFHEKQEKAA